MSLSAPALLPVPRIDAAFGGFYAELAAEQFGPNHQLGAVAQYLACAEAHGSLDSGRFGVVRDDAAGARVACRLAHDHLTQLAAQARDSARSLYTAAGGVLHKDQLGDLVVALHGDGDLIDIQRTDNMLIACLEDFIDSAPDPLMVRLATTLAVMLSRLSPCTATGRDLVVDDPWAVAVYKAGDDPMLAEIVADWEYDGWPERDTVRLACAEQLGLADDEEGLGDIVALLWSRHELSLDDLMAPLAAAEHISSQDLRILCDHATRIGHTHPIVECARAVSRLIDALESCCALDHDGLRADAPMITITLSPFDTRIAEDMAEHAMACDTETGVSISPACDTDPGFVDRLAALLARCNLAQLVVAHCCQCGLFDRFDDVKDKP